MKTSSNLIFFGNERLSTGFTPNGAPVLESLLAAGYTISAVVANYEQGRSRNARELEVAAVAKAHNIPVLLPKKLRDIRDELAAYNAQAGILVAYGKIIPQSIIELFPKGIVNIHPSLLPLYRGPTPIEQALLDNPAETGVSIMALAKEMDAGPIYAQVHIPLSGDETKQALTEKLLFAGRDLLLEQLPYILEGALPTPQIESDATYCQLISKTDGNLHFDEPASVLERKIRAFATWPQTRASLHLADGTELPVIITQATVKSLQLPNGTLQIDKNELLVGTTKNTLSISRLKVPGKKEMTAADFIRGYLR